MKNVFHSNVAWRMKNEIGQIFYLTPLTFTLESRPQRYRHSIADFRICNLEFIRTIANVLSEIEIQGHIVSKLDLCYSTANVRKTRST